MEHTHLPGGSRTPGSTAAAMEEEGRLFDVEQARLWMGFMWRSLWRHKLRAGVALLLVLMASLFAATSSQALYQVSTSFIAQADRTKSVTNPSLTIDNQTDSTLIDVEGTVKSEANLRRLIEQTKADQTYYATESGVAHFRRQQMEKLLGAPTQEQFRSTIIRQLRSGIDVVVEPTTATVTISVSWPDPDMAVVLANQARENLLSDRRKDEIDQYQTALDIVSARATQARSNVVSLRERLGVPETSQTPLSDGSPLKPALTVQAALDEREENARIALQTAEASFEGRYRVVTQAELPAMKISTRSKLILLGLIASMLAALLAAAARDILSGRLVEQWQVTRQCHLPVLTHVD